MASLSKYRSKHYYNTTTYHQSCEGDPNHGTAIEDHHCDLEHGVGGQVRPLVILDQPGPIIITDTISEEEIAIGEAISEPPDVGLSDSEGVRLLEVLTVLGV